MAARRFERIASLQFLMGSAVVFSAYLIGPAHAQSGFAPGVSFPKPSQIDQTLPQRTYTPLSYTTPSVVPAHTFASPVSHGGVHIVETRSDYSNSTDPKLASYSTACGYLGCVRTYAWAFPCQYYSRYCNSYGAYRGN